MAFSDWSTTAASNTSIGGIGIQGTNVVKNFDNALREMMAQLKAGVPAKVPTTTDNTLPRFDGTSGQFQTSGIVVSDANDMTSVNSLGVVGAVSAGSFSTTGTATAGTLKGGNAVAFATGKLEIATASGIAGVVEYSGGSGGAGLGINRTSSDGAVIATYRGGTQVGSISVTGSATAYNTSSDYRIKDDVQAYSGGLAAICKLKPSTYVIKSDPDKIRQIGFIAHEVQEIFPLAVTGEKDAVDEDGNMIIQQLDATKTLPAVVSAIQELSCMADAIPALTAAIQELQAKIEAMGG